jgi:hypothetical protein
MLLHLLYGKHCLNHLLYRFVTLKHKLYSLLNIFHKAIFPKETDVGDVVIIEVTVDKKATEKLRREIED